LADTISFTYGFRDLLSIHRVYTDSILQQYNEIALYFLEIIQFYIAILEEEPTIKLDFEGEFSAAKTSVDVSGIIL
jgi:hypothetical protein